MIGARRAAAATRRPRRRRPGPAVHTESGQFLKPVTVIAITGGPCGGKTSALVELASTLPTFGGVDVMTAPEFSTLFFAGGVRLSLLLVLLLVLLVLLLLILLVL